MCSSSWPGTEEISKEDLKKSVVSVWTGFFTFGKPSGELSDTRNREIGNLMSIGSTSIAPLRVDESVNDVIAKNF